MTLQFPRRNRSILKTPDQFKVIEEEGKGAYSIVEHVIDPITMKSYALKKMDLSKLGKKDYENIVKEIESHKEMNHPNIIKMIDFLKDGDMVYILLEYVKKGNLFFYLTKKRRLEESLIAKFFYQVCKGIEHIHSKNFIHRDLKPENILLDSDLNAKICDFGWCTAMWDKEYRRVVGGTYEYMAPETLRKELQGKEIDIWALGVLLYELIHNREPYKGKSTKGIMKEILGKELKYSRRASEEAIDLMKKLMTFDPAERPSLAEVFKHPFFKKHGVLPKEKISFAPFREENSQQVIITRKAIPTQESRKDYSQKGKPRPMSLNKTTKEYEERAKRYIEQNYGISSKNLKYQGQRKYESSSKLSKQTVERSLSKGISKKPKEKNILNKKYNFESTTSLNSKGLSNASEKYNKFETLEKTTIRGNYSSKYRGSSLDSRLKLNAQNVRSNSNFTAYHKGITSSFNKNFTNQRDSKNEFSNHFLLLNNKNSDHFVSNKAPSMSKLQDTKNDKNISSTATNLRKAFNTNLHSRFIDSRNNIKDKVKQLRKISNFNDPKKMKSGMLLREKSKVMRITNNENFYGGFQNRNKNEGDKSRTALRSRSRLIKPKCGRKAFSDGTKLNFQLSRDSSPSKQKSFFRKINKFKMENKEEKKKISSNVKYGNFITSYLSKKIETDVVYKPKVEQLIKKIDPPGTPLIKTGKTSTTRNTISTPSSTSKISNLNSELLNFNIRLFKNNKLDAKEPKIVQTKQKNEANNDHAKFKKNQISKNNFKGIYQKMGEIVRGSHVRKAIYSSKNIYSAGQFKLDTEVREKSRQNRARRDFGFYKSIVGKSKQYRKSYYKVDQRLVSNSRQKDRSGLLNSYSNKGSFKAAQKYSNYNQMENSQN